MGCLVMLYGWNPQPRLITKIFLDRGILLKIIFYGQIVKWAKLTNAMGAISFVKIWIENFAFLEKLFFIWIPPASYLGNFLIQVHSLKQIFDPKFNWQTGILIGSGNETSCFVGGKAN